MSKGLRNRVLLIIVILLGCLYFTFPVEKRINLGLDLKGGMHLVLQVETDKLDENAKLDAVLRAIEILRNRIDGIGVGETVIQRQGENEILIQLPGVTDRDKAVNLIGTVAQLDFHLVSDDAIKLKQALEGKIPDGYELKSIKKDSQEPVLIEKKIALSGTTVTDARVDFDSQGFGQPHISLTLNSEGAKDFAKVTAENVNRRLAIVLDDAVLSAPNINEAITGGKAQISGQFTLEEASVLALSLRSGALPAPMHIEEERTIGPLLGKDSIKAGINATIIGGALVFVFMFIYYLKAGLISNVALLLNLLMIFGTMGFLNAMLPSSPLVLTLPGIAGIILTLGMAVDANVLINERIREELNNGRPLQAAVNNGFSKALKAIIDSNSTTLIAAFMLFQFGSGPIKGFAVTLSIGLLVSLFTALFVTRTLFNILLELKLLKNLNMLRFLDNTNINFLSKRYFCYFISATLVIASIVMFIHKKEDAYGIDFAGGQIQEYKFAEPVGSDAIRMALREIGLDKAIIQQFDQYPGHIIIRTPNDTYQKVSDTFTSYFPDNSYEVLRIERVGPVVGKALRKAALFAIIFALGGILIFVGFRFKHFDFATAGVIALLHDVVITLGILIMLNRQVDLLVVTALLTIAGYSINDTIIIYDRVRENLVKNRKQNLAEVLNLSVNQTLGRTLLTTITTGLVVITIFVKGGEVLNTFALCLIIGFVAGTYSTIFIASPLVLTWQKKS
ncbi:MAG: protein translocase subunit SecD [Candidatus Omnitrophica bacterium]|nr:protein translocase subunit SecD [Candidatus Omnitrophota bacterium]